MQSYTDRDAGHIWKKNKYIYFEGQICHIVNVKYTFMGK